MDSAIILLVAVSTVALSAIYSGLETGVYRLSRLRLRLGAEKGQLHYVWLNKTMQGKSGPLLSLLVANNLANYAATSSTTYLFTVLVPSQFPPLIPPPYRALLFTMVQLIMALSPSESDPQPLMAPPA